MLPPGPSAFPASSARPLTPSHGRTSSVPYAAAHQPSPPVPVFASSRRMHTRHRRAQTLSPDTASWLKPPPAPSSFGALMDVSGAARFNDAEEDDHGPLGSAPRTSGNEEPKAAPVPAAWPARPQPHRRMHSRNQSRSLITLPFAPPPPVCREGSGRDPIFTSRLTPVQPPTVTDPSPIRPTGLHQGWSFRHHQAMPAGSPSSPTSTCRPEGTASERTRLSEFSFGRSATPSTTVMPRMPEGLQPAHAAAGPRSLPLALSSTPALAGTGTGRSRRARCHGGSINLSISVRAPADTATAMRSVETALGVPSSSRNSLGLQLSTGSDCNHTALGSPLPSPSLASSPFLSPLLSPGLAPRSPTVDADVRASPAPAPTVLGLKEDPELAAAMRDAEKGPVIICPGSLSRENKTTKGGRKSVRFRLPVDLIGTSAFGTPEIAAVSQDETDKTGELAEHGDSFTRLSEGARLTIERLKKRASLTLPPHQARHHHGHEQECQPSIDLDLLTHIESELDASYHASPGTLASTSTSVCATSTTSTHWGGKDLTSLEMPALSPAHLSHMPALSPAPSSGYASSVSSPMPLLPLPLSETDMGLPDASMNVPQRWPSPCPRPGLALTAGLGIAGLPDFGAADCAVPKYHGSCDTSS